MDYKKKSLNKINRNETYEEIDTRLASGWYVDSLGNNKKKKYKTKEVSFTISKKGTVFFLVIWLAISTPLSPVGKSSLTGITLFSILRK